MTAADLPARVATDDQALTTSTPGPPRCWSSHGPPPRV